MSAAESLANAPAARTLTRAGDANRLEACLRLVQERGDIFELPLPDLGGAALVVGNPHWANHILVSQYQSYKKGVGYGQMRLLLGNGVITLDGERWKRQRRILIPVYARS